MPFDADAPDFLANTSVFSTLDLKSGFWQILARLCHRGQPTPYHRVVAVARQKTSDHKAGNKGK